ncbi:endonuclease/exonuclease/phosphatase family protein [Crocinitomicaceae bacterium]|nr:endonuclease/exonuclease/phosphatase family protein [Crocinitomicaceae bacterium]
MAEAKKTFTFKLLLKVSSVGCSIALILSYLSPFVDPNSWKLLPLFGLGYPITICVQLVLIVLWTFVNKKWALALGVVILACGNMHFRTFTIGTGDDPNGATEVNILSYNVRLFDRYNPNFKAAIKSKDQIIEFVKNKNADVVCFQEFFHQDQPTAFVTKDTLIDLLNTPYYHERYAHTNKGNHNFGIALFSKYPILNKGEIVFKGSTLSFNYCIYADIETPDGLLRVYNVHLQSIRLNKEDYNAINNTENGKLEGSNSNVFSILRKITDAYPIRANQAKQLVKHIQKSPHPVVVCGDFNDTPMSFTYNEFSAILTDAFRNSSWGIGKTYAGTLPAGRIDYIFHSPEIGSRNFNIQDEKQSDHYAINTSIFLKKEE